MAESEARTTDTAKPEENGAMAAETPVAGAGNEPRRDHQEERPFGWLCFKPKWLQRCNTPRWAAGAYFFVVTVESAIVLGLFAVVIPTVERRYRLSSTESGFIIGAYESAAAIGVIPISYYGDRAHKTRWLGFGSLLLGIGSLVFALPQFVSGSYHASGQERLEYCGDGLNHSVYASSGCDEDQQLALSLLLLGEVLMALGALPVFTLGFAFIDEIVGPNKVHMYLALLYVWSTVGTTLGFLIGSFFLAQYVDTNVENPPDELDPSFVGRWWAGYVLAGVLAIVASIPMFAYPKVIPGTEWIMQEKRAKQRGQGACSRLEEKSGSTSKQEVTGVRERIGLFITHFKKVVQLCVGMLLTGVLFFNILGSSADAMLINGVGPFFTKFVQSQFRLTASTASLLTGGVLVPAIAGGIFFSAWLLKKRKVHGVRLAKYTFIIASISTVFGTAFLVHCNTANIVGATVTYPKSDVKTADRCKQPLNSSCMASCGCVSERYDPVCGSDGRTYLTPCLAGCHDYPPGSSVNDRVYYNCSCIPEDNTNLSRTIGGIAKTGFCSTGCNLLPLFTFVFLLLLFTTSMNAVPVIEVVLRVVPAEHRTLATGVQWIMIRVLGNIPAPILFGFLLDGTCILWELRCCNRGNCWEYDNPAMSYTIFTALFISKLLSILCFFLSWRFFIRDGLRQSHPKTELEAQFKSVTVSDGGREALVDKDNVDMDGMLVMH